MSYQFRGLQISVLIHALAVLAVFSISASIVSGKKTLVIDFSLEDPAIPEKQRPGPPPPPALHKKEPLKPKKERAVTPRIVEKKPVIKEDRPVREPEVAPSLSESQVAVPAPEVKKEIEPRTRPVPSPVIAALPAATATASTEDYGSSPEGVQKRYIRQHFTYIRDTIRKKLTYPLIARRRGWMGTTTVSFIVCTDGTARELSIEKGSGIALLDHNALEAVRKALPFPKPPLEAKIIIPIEYRLN